MPASSLEQVVNLCKRRGFVYPGSEIYGGLANTWDYGPHGAVLKEQIRRWWIERFVERRSDMVLIDPANLMNPKVWEASGHTANFNDAMVDCKQCKGRFRADHLIEDVRPEEKVEGKSPAELSASIKEQNIACPTCGANDMFTDARTFNLLFETQLGTLEDDSQRTVYLRGEIAQAMFVNFKNVLTTSRKRIPFGIAAIGKAYRNEITPGNFTFRTLEFDLMEFEYFVREHEWQKHFEYWLSEQQQWLKEMGITESKLRVREHTQDELSHYSKRTVDVEYETPFGWKELFGLAYRTDFDLNNHMKMSGQDLSVMDPETEEKFVPHVVEPTFGLSRLTLMVLLDAYSEEQLKSGEMRTLLKLHSRLAPVQVAVLPLSKDDRLIAKSREIEAMLREKTGLRVDFDFTGSIGKRYRRQDEIGTPTCLTVDFGTIGDDEKQCKKDHITLRDRDSLAQREVAVGELVEVLS